VNDNISTSKIEIEINVKSVNLQLGLYGHLRERRAITTSRGKKGIYGGKKTEVADLKTPFARLLLAGSSAFLQDYRTQASLLRTFSQFLSTTNGSLAASYGPSITTGIQLLRFTFLQATEI
jgi:hypothetical protein